MIQVQAEHIFRRQLSQTEIAMESQSSSEPTGADCLSAGQREIDVFHRARRGRDLHIREGLVDQLALVERAAIEAARLAPARMPTEASPRPMNMREVQRALRLVERVTRQMDSIRQDLVKASSAKAPRSKVRATFKRLLASGELLESSRFQEQAGWTRQALSKAVLSGRVFFLDVAGVRAYPAFYLDLRYNRRDVETVAKLLGDLSGGRKWLFFTTHKASLARSHAGPRAGEVPAANHARTPLEALDDGDLDRVKRAAIGYAER